MKKLIVIVLIALLVGASIIAWRHAESRKDIKTAMRSSATAVQSEILTNAVRLEALLKKCRETARKYEQAKKQQNQ